MIYYDSLCGSSSSDRCQQLGCILKRWLEDEAAATCNQSVETLTGLAASDWLVRLEDNLPLQTDDTECGIHLLMNADFISAGLELGGAYVKEDTIRFRKKIGCDLIRGALLYTECIQ